MSVPLMPVARAMSETLMIRLSRSSRGFHMPLRWMLIMLAATSCAAQVEPTATAPAAPTPAEQPATQAAATSIPVGSSEVPTDELLDAMEKLGVTMKTLKADVAMSDINTSTG